MYSHERRYFFGGVKLSAISIFASAILLSAMAAASPALAGAAGSYFTADRELGEPDFLHTMFNFGGPSALSGPAGVAVDSAGHLYVADSINNRVLGWSSASAFANGDAASLVIG